MPSSGPWAPGPVASCADKAPNAVIGIEYLEAFNQGRLQAVSPTVVVVGGGDTSIDVASVARRLGTIEGMSEDEYPENVIAGKTTHNYGDDAKRKPAKVILLSRSPIDKMNAAEHEIHDAQREGIRQRSRQGRARTEARGRRQDPHRRLRVRHRDGSHRRRHRSGRQAGRLRGARQRSSPRTC